MPIELCAKWERMTMQEAAAQYTAKCRGCSGQAGYLVESYYGGAYPTHMLAPEAYVYGSARIPAAVLRARLPGALYEIETRELCCADVRDPRRATERLQQQFRDFVELCERKEEETGLPCLLVSSL